MHAGVTLKVNGKKISIGERIDADNLRKATHFSVWDCAAEETAEVLPDLTTAIVRMRQINSIRNSRRLVYAYHFKLNIDICFGQVLLTERLLDVSRVLWGLDDEDQQQ